MYLPHNLRLIFCAVFITFLSLGVAADEGDDTQDLSTLPNELILEVMENLSPKDLLNFMMGSQYLFKLGENSPVFKVPCQQKAINQLNRLSKPQLELSNLSIEKIKTITRKDISNLTWRELYLAIVALEVSPETFIKHKGASLPADGVFKTVSTTVTNSLGFTVVGVPVLVGAGMVLQIWGLTSLALSIPVLATGNFYLSTELFCNGVTGVVSGTASEAFACLVPASGALYGLLKLKWKRNEKLDIMWEDFQRQAWKNTRDSCENNEIPAILKLLHPYEFDDVDEGY